MSTPALSVLIDTYNHERYIEQALLSVLEQDFPSSETEIVVVDDGSTDRTPDIVSKFAPRVRLLRKKNGGQASAFNAAIPELRGEAVSFLDGDDWFAQGKLTAVANALEQHPNASAIGHGYYEVTSGSDQFRACLPSEAKFVDMSTAEGAVQAFAEWFFLLMGALSIRRPFLQRILPIHEDLTFCADSPITVAAMAGGAYILKEPLFYYRHHEGNLHATNTQDKAKLRRKFEMKEKVPQLLEPVLLGLNVPRQFFEPTLSQLRNEASRAKLRECGGSRLETFQTEMRSFRFEYKNPSLGYTLYKRFIFGGLTLLLPPKLFYRLLDWYAGENLGVVRERILKSGNRPIPHP